MTFVLTSSHLVANLLEEGWQCKLALRSIGNIEIVGSELRLHLHLPIPIFTDAGIRPVHVLYGDVDEAAAARWTWLSSRNNRSSAECPYCFKTALEIEPRPEAPQPMRKGRPIAVASCCACERRFDYDYEQGIFEGTSEPADELAEGLLAPAEA